MKDPMKPRDKITQKMSRDGLTEQNQTTGESELISKRIQDADFQKTPEQQAAQDAAQLQGAVSPSSPLPHAPEHFSKPQDAAAERVMEHIGAGQTRKASKKAVRRAQEAAASKAQPSRLQFTDEERATPELEKYIKKSDKAADRLDAARAALPPKKKSRLQFDKQETPPSFEGKRNPLSRPAQEAGIFVHNKIHSVEKDNSGVEGAHKSEEAAERMGKYGVRKVKEGYRSHKLKPYRKAAQAEKAAAKANANFYYHKALHDNPQLRSNPLSRFMQKQKIKADLAALPESERNILTLAGARLLMACAEPHIFEAVTAVFSCAGQEFTAKGKTVLAEGWKGLERRFMATLKKKADTEDDEENALSLDVPPFAEGQTFDNPQAAVTEHFTTPPKPHNEASLLSAMERAGNEETDPDAERRGLGTPATRAAIIEKLVKGGFVERKGKQLIPTKSGIELVCVLPEVLTSPQLTADWENNLTQIAKGNADPDSFMTGIETMTRELVSAYPFLSDKEKERFKEEKPVIGKCPRCGANIYEGRKNYYCANRDCAFTMWKNDRFFEERKVTFSPKIAAALLKDGKAKVKKLYSPKTGKTYDGTILLADTGGKYVNYRIAIQRDREVTQQA